MKESESQQKENPNDIVSSVTVTYTINQRRDGSFVADGIDFIHYNPLMHLSFLGIVRNQIKKLLLFRDASRFKGSVDYIQQLHESEIYYDRLDLPQIIDFEDKEPSLHKHWSEVMKDRKMEELNLHLQSVDYETFQRSFLWGTDPNDYKDLSPASKTKK